MAHIAVDEFKVDGEFTEFAVVCYCGHESYASNPLEARRAFVEHADEQRANDAITAKR